MKMVKIEEVRVGDIYLTTNKVALLVKEIRSKNGVFKLHSSDLSIYNAGDLIQVFESKDEVVQYELVKREAIQRKAYLIESLSPERLEELLQEYKTECLEEKHQMIFDDTLPTRYRSDEILSRLKDRISAAEKEGILIPEHVRKAASL